MLVLQLLLPPIPQLLLHTTACRQRPQQEDADRSQGVKTNQAVRRC